MHDETAGRAHAVLMEIEPALPGDEIVHLHQAQQAVIVAIGIGKRREPGHCMRDEDGDRDQRGGSRVTPYRG